MSPPRKQIVASIDQSHALDKTKACIESVVDHNHQMLIEQSAERNSNHEIRQALLDFLLTCANIDSNVVRAC